MSQRIANFNQQLQRINQLRQQQLDELQANKTEQLRVLDQVKSQLAQAEYKLVQQNFAHHSAEYKQLQAQNIKLMEQVNRNNEVIQRQIEEVQAQRDELTAELQLPEIDEIAMALNFYKQLGFHWDASLTKCQVKNSKGDEVATVSVMDGDRYQLAQKLWQAAM